MHFWKRFAKADDGASAVEFALVFPVFATMMFGSVQMGLAYYKAGSVQYALERTARVRMVSTLTASQMQTQFNTELAKYTDESITLNYSTAVSGGVTIATLSATYTHHFVIPLVPSFNIAFPVIAKVPVT